MRRRDFFKNSPKLFRSLIEYGRKGSSEERERGGLRNIFGGRSECNLSDLEPLDQVTILHSPGNIAVISDTNCDEDDDKISDIPVNSDPSKKNPVRKNTLSSGEVTVIAAPEAVIDDHDERRYVTITSIFITLLTIISTIFILFLIIVQPTKPTTWWHVTGRVITVNLRLLRLLHEHVPIIIARLY